MLIYILILGLILRIIGINQSLWLDEATTANVLRQFSLPQIVTQFSPGDFHPSGYYLILKVYSTFLGTSEIALRSFSVLCGLGTIAVVYHIGKKLGNRSSATLAALLMATGPLAIYYSGEVRMYALASLFVSLSVLAFLNIAKKATKFWLVLFILSSLGSYFTLYPTIFMIPVFLFMAKTKKIYVAHLVIALVLTFYLPIFLNQINAGLNTGQAWGEALGALNFKNLILIPVKFLIGRIGFESKLVYACFTLVGAYIYGLGLFKARKHKLLWYWLVLPIVLASLISIRLAMLSYFRFLFVLPAFYLLAALGLQKLKSRYFLPAVLAVLFFNLMSALIYLNNDKFYREDWKGLVKTIKQQTEDVSYKLIFPKNSQMEAVKYYCIECHVGGGEDEVLDNFDQLWYVRYAVDIVDPSESARSKIEGLGYKKQEEFDFRGVSVWKYTKL